MTEHQFEFDLNSIHTDLSHDDESVTLERTPPPDPADEVIEQPVNYRSLKNKTPDPKPKQLKETPTEKRAREAFEKYKLRRKDLYPDD